VTIHDSANHCDEHEAMRLLQHFVGEFENRSGSEVDESEDLFPHFGRRAPAWL
jgi:hypothetical protein